MTDADLRSHLAGTPVRSTRGRRLNRRDDDCLHIFVGDLAWGPDPRLVIEALHSLRDEALPPLADRLVRRPAPTSDVRAADAFSARQHKLRSKSEMSVHPRPLSQPDKILALVSSKDQRCLALLTFEWVQITAS